MYIFVCIDIFASFDWYHYIIHTIYLHNTYQYIPWYMPILLRWAKNSVLHWFCIDMYLACVMVCYRMYWYVLACIWHVKECIQFRFSTQVFAQCTSIGMYFGIFCYVLSKYWACIQTQYVLITTWRPILLQVLWYVLVCIDLYWFVWAHICLFLITNWL